VFEDEYILVYRTRCEAAPLAHLTPDLALAWVRGPSGPLRQGETFSVEVVWTTERSPAGDWGLDVRLQDEQGQIAQQVAFPLQPDHPTSAWPGKAAIRGQYTLEINPHLPPGHYDLTLALVPLSDSSAPEARVSVGTIENESLERSFTVPPLEHKTNAIFSDTLKLPGYVLRQEPGDLRITLYWQALRRMDYYKTFVHLYDTQSGAVVAQYDAVPRGWTYPTNWWEAGEVVSDEITLPLEGIPTGQCRIAVGVYAPDTLERLPAQTEPGMPLGDHLELEDIIRVP
jgi:hypothetical protein